MSSSEPLIVNKHLSIKLDQYEENKRFLTIKNENDLQSEASEYIIGPWNILHDSDIHGRKSDLQSNIQYLEEKACNIIDNFETSKNLKIFTYGPSGSGKTYFMLGRPGIQGLLYYLLRCIKNKYTFKNISSHEYIPYVLDESGFRVDSKTINELNNIEEINNQLMTINEKRQTKLTNLNEESSRSHLIFIFEIEIITALN